MAKQIDELTVGIVTKVMTHIGWVIFEEGELTSSVIEDYTTADRIGSLSGRDYTVKPVYIEESPK